MSSFLKSRTVSLSLGVLLLLVLTACPGAVLPGVVSVTITGGDVALSLGETLPLSAGVVIRGDVSDGVTWASANASVATIDQTGAITAVAVGSTTITATSVFDPTVLDEVTATVYPSGSVRWTRQFGTAREDRVNDVAIDSVGNIAVVGYTEGDLERANGGGNKMDAYVRVYDPHGDVLWAEQFGFTDHDEATGVAFDADDNVIVVGYVRGNLGGVPSGESDAFVRKYSPSGTVLWTRQFGTAGFDTAQAVATDSDGNIFVVGDTTGNLAGEVPEIVDAFVRKYDSFGNALWTRQFRHDERTFGRSVATDEDGNVVVLVYMQVELPGEPWPYDYMAIRKYDTNGNNLWNTQFGSDEGEGYSEQDVATDAFGNVIVVGETSGDLADGNLGSSDGYVLKFNAVDGMGIWSRHAGTATSDGLRGVATDSDNNIIVVGSTFGSLEGTSFGDYDAIALKYNAAGSVIWTDQFGTADTDFAMAVATDSRGNFVVVGSSWDDLGGPNAGLIDVFVRSYMR